MESVSSVPSPKTAWLGFGFYISTVLFAVLGFIIAAVLVLAATGAVSPEALQNTESLSPSFVLPVMVVQFSVMTGWTWVAFKGAELIGQEKGKERWFSSIWDGGSPWVFYVLAIGMGATIGWLPGLLSELMSEYFPGLDLGALGDVASLITSDSPLVFWGAAAMIGVFGPIAEEVVFRGFLWTRLESAAGSKVAFIVTSILFAAIHMDPAQAIPLLPTAFLLGWLRWTSGSLGPCLVLHIVNNSLAVVLTKSGYADSDWSLGVILGMFAVAMGLAVVSYRRSPVRL